MAIKLCSLCKLQPRSPFSVWIFSVPQVPTADVWACFGFSNLEASTKNSKPVIKSYGCVAPILSTSTVFIRKTAPTSVGIFTSHPRRIHLGLRTRKPWRPLVSLVRGYGGERWIWRWIKGRFLSFHLEVNLLPDGDDGIGVGLKS